MDAKRIRVTDFATKKRQDEKIVMLTAYDATMARLFDRAGVDALLVGDSLGTVILGLDTTLPVTLDAVVHHTRAVSRGAERALVVADMPFLTFQVSVADAVRNAGRLLQEGGAAAVKLEGGRPVIDVVKRLVDVGIPVMGHLGLQPQSVHQAGGYVRRATQPREAEALLADALALAGRGRVRDRPGGDTRRRGARHHARAGGANHRHRRRARLRRPGPRQLRHARALRRLRSVVRASVRATLATASVTAAEEYAADVRNGRYPERAKPAVVVGGTSRRQ